MTERKYTRAEFETELRATREGYDDAKKRQAQNRLLSWFDEVQLDLGHIGALYDNLRRVTAEKVAAEVRAEEAEQRIWHLERQLAAKRVEEEEEDD